MLGKLYKKGHHSSPPSGHDGDRIHDPNRHLPMGGPHATPMHPATTVHTPNKKGPVMGEHQQSRVTETGILGGAKKNPY